MLYHNNKVNVESVMPKLPAPHIYQPEDVGLLSVAGTGKDVQICIIDSGVPDHQAINNIVDEANFAGTGSIRDEMGHSTIVSGLILGNMPGEFVGIAPDASAIFAKVIDDQSRTRLDAIVAAIIWGVIKESDIICICISSPVDSPSIRDAIQKANDNNILVICSAGNSNTVEFPAHYPETFSVGALDSNMLQSVYSAQGDINAMGNKMLAPYVEQQYCLASGTSVATSLVCGAATRHVSLMKESGTDFTPKSIYAMMKASP